MDDSKKMIRIIMIGVVLTAIVVGIVYYYHESQNKTVSDKGTLIANYDMGWYELWLQ